MSQRGSLGVGLIGYGQAATTLHIPLIDATPGLHVAGIAVASEAGRSRAQAAHPRIPAFTSLDRLLELDGLDMVVIASPNATHADHAVRALQAGLDVIVDKPMATTARDARRVQQAAESLGRRVMTFVNRRWDGDYAALHRVIRAGRLGTPLRLESRWERHRPDAPLGSWKNERSAGGGLLWNLLPHLVDQALHLLGPAAWVWARLEARRPGSQADDESWVIIGHRDGATSHLLGSYLSSVAGPRLRLVGSDATFVGGELDPAPASSHPTAHLCEPDSIGDRLRRAARIVDASGSHALEVGDDDHGAFYRAVVAARAGDGPFPAEPDEGVVVVEVLEAAEVADRTGARVDVGALAAAS